jgi:DNA-binding PadR family transcriptional regulator
MRNFDEFGSGPRNPRDRREGRGRFGPGREARGRSDFGFDFGRGGGHGGDRQGRHGGGGGGGGHAGGGRRARRGNVRAAILALLCEQSMHGYQMIQELSRRSGGAWTPSPGSIYPTLQLLEDEGLVTSHQSPDGKRMFEITDAGRAEAARSGSAAGQRPWEQSGHGRRGMPVDIGSAIRDTAIALVYAATSGTDEQRAQVISLLAEFRQKLSDVVPGAPSPGDPRGPWGGGRPRGNWSRSGPGWSFGVPSWLFGGPGGGPFGPGGIWGSNTPDDEPWASEGGDDGDVDFEHADGGEHGDVEV